MECSDCKPSVSDHPFYGRVPTVILCPLHASAKQVTEERDALRIKYDELVDALCSKSWLGRTRHASVLSLASRLSDSQNHLKPLELERMLLTSYCYRLTGHDGPCNGLPRTDCLAKETK